MTVETYVTVLLAYTLGYMWGCFNTYQYYDSNKPVKKIVPFISPPLTGYWIVGCYFGLLFILALMLGGLVK